MLPRVSLRPPGVVRSSGPDAVELAGHCGVLCDEWQGDELHWSLAETSAGFWAASEIDLICARQNGKNVILEVRELYGLIVLGERILHTAHLFPTAKESYAALETMVRAHPDIAAQLVDHHASPASGYDMTFRSGGRIQYIARSRTSGRGFRGIDLLVFDEAQDLNDDAQGALLPTIASKPHAQTWYQGSAPDIGSVVLHRIRTAGRSGSEGRVSYAEFSADPDVDLDDREQWAQANPAFPHRISEETIESERRQMSPEEFARERLSVSPDLIEAGGPFGDAWAAVNDADAAAVASAFAFDVNPERSAAGIAVCGPVGVLEVVDYHPGTGWLVERIVELHERYDKPFAVDARGPAGSFVDELRRRGVTVIELQSTDMTRAAGDFFDAVFDAAFTVRNNADLDRAVAGAVKKAVGDAFVWGRKSSHSDICLLVAVSIARWAALGDGGETELW